MNSHRNRPEVQARLAASLASPEWQRRKALYRTARGDKKRRVAHWNIAWNVAGRPSDFPDFAEWDAGCDARPLEGRRL